MDKTKNRERVGITVAGICSVLVYHLIYRDFYPNSAGLLGNDYSLALTWLMDGYYWSQQNGYFSIPWFTPSFCAGIPAFPAISNFYFSLPQALTLAFDPLLSTYLTGLSFSGIGFLGFFLLLRGPFKVDPWSALLGAVVFQFNGFFVHRMLIGHLVFHGFMLLPLISYLILRNRPALLPQRISWLNEAAGSAGIALMLAYMFYCGMATVIPPVMMTLLAFILIHGLMHGNYRQPIIRLLTGGLLFTLIGLAKLISAAAFTSHFPRDLYPIPGFKSFSMAIEVLLDALFIGAPADLLSASITNTPWTLQQHAIEFGVSVVPLILLLLWLTSPGTITRLIKRIREQSSWLGLAAISVLIILFSLPVLINIYNPTWHSILKALPVISNSSNLVRWFCFYIPLVTLIGALALSRTEYLRLYRIQAALVGVAIVLAQNLWQDRSFYEQQSYDPQAVVTHYKAVHGQDNWRPGIAFLGVHQDSTGQMTLPLDRNDVFMEGFSPVSCYEPSFGYRLELFQFESLVPGSIYISRQEGQYNMKNPACYLYPEENNCNSNAQFTVQQRDSLSQFAAYQPWNFVMPWYQHLSNRISLLTLVVCLLVSCVGFAVLQFREFTQPCRH